MTEETDEPSVSASRTPPYISFSSFQTMIGDFKENGIPPRVDRSVLTRFAGGLASQLIMALKSLGLTDEKNQPTGIGRNFIEAYGTDDYKSRLRGVLKLSYPFLSTLNLMEATPSMFAEAFKNGTGAKEDVLRKCRTFFLHAAQVAELPVGPRLLSAKGSRSQGAPRKKPKPSKSRVAEGAPNLGATSGVTPPAPPETVATKLLDKFPQFDPNWGPEIQAKWFEGYSRLLAIGDKA